MSENWATAYSSGPCDIIGLDQVNVDECENSCKVIKIKLTKKITVNIYNEEITI